MSLRSTIARICLQEDINFLLTNRIPRLAFTRFMGKFSRIEQPAVRALSIALWRFFCDVDLTDARKSTFVSLHDAFIRQLEEGARPINTDPACLAAPCDAIVGAHGRITKGQVYQIKGFPYDLGDLLGDVEQAAQFEGGLFVTMRLTAGMYHRFHAPAALSVEQVRYISGDTWNVNPIALKRIERLFCKNERAPITVRLTEENSQIVLVPVAAVLVASIRLPFLDQSKGVREGGARVEMCQATFERGEEMGWFEHGSTIVMVAPPGWRLATDITAGQPIRMGRDLLWKM
ncbi:phosphatidylserine decarboxylase [Altererythrobacter indicus]|uniref:phosphatidylserine decarboxylase n=1 Tax=Altericroceibacterium indicum TaxID=374177 RepID=A0A845AC96_9SPHN|nr:archaetidylserine decarboxylase [Altericroceibacterium indicum]MXP26176.1 phosphatidylserine decarboxylase [Altericroceibacterium indicum]